MKHLLGKKFMVFVLLLMTIPAFALANGDTVAIIQSMAPNTLVADINGKTETFLLERYDNFGNGPSITFARKDARNESLDSVSLIVSGTPHVGNIIDTTSQNVVDYGAGSVNYLDFQQGSPKNYTASFYCEMSGGSSYDEFFNNVTVHAVISPSSSASYRLTFDYMSADGQTMGGTVKGVLINSQNGSQVTISNGYFNYVAR